MPRAHLIEWLRNGYVNCQDGRRDWCESYLNQAADEIERLRAGLKALAEPQAFYVATSDVPPEALGRMIFAEEILKGSDLGLARKISESAAHVRAEANYAQQLRKSA